jgi:hypothetical protein
MNWKKGLVRLWIAGSLLWITCYSIYLKSDNIRVLAEPQQQVRTLGNSSPFSLARLLHLLYLASGFGGLLLAFKHHAEKEEATT